MTTAKRTTFEVRMCISAVDEEAVWNLLRQLPKDVEGAGLEEEPEVWAAQS